MTGEGDGVGPAGERLEQAAGFHLRQLRGVADEDELAARLAGDLVEPRELSGADHAGLVEQQYAASRYVARRVAEQPGQRGRRRAGRILQSIRGDRGDRNTSDRDLACRPRLGCRGERPGLAGTGRSRDGLRASPGAGDHSHQLDLVDAQLRRRDRQVHRGVGHNCKAVGCARRDRVEGVLFDGEHVDGRVGGPVAGDDGHHLVVAEQLARQGEDLVGRDVGTGRQVLADLAHEPASVERRPVARDALRAEDGRCQRVPIDRGWVRGLVQQAAYGVGIHTELGGLNSPPRP